MSLIQCPTCNKRVSSRAAKCTKCGAPIATNDDELTERATSRRRWEINRRLQNYSFLSLIIFLVGIFLFWYHKSDPVGWKYLLGEFLLVGGFLGYSILRMYKIFKK